MTTAVAGSSLDVANLSVLSEGHRNCNSTFSDARLLLHISRYETCATLFRLV